jgi:hypothetical protein
MFKSLRFKVVLVEDSFESGNAKQLETAPTFTKSLFSDWARCPEI